MQVDTKRTIKKTVKVTPKHNIVVVRAAALQENPDMDEDLFRLKVNYHTL